MDKSKYVKGDKVFLFDTQSSFWKIVTDEDNKTGYEKCEDKEAKLCPVGKIGSLLKGL